MQKKETHVTSPSWLREQILPHDLEHAVLLAGSAGAGKTFLRIDWALCIASGSPWCGYPTTQHAVLSAHPTQQMGDVSQGNVSASCSREGIPGQPFSFLILECGSLLS